MVKDIRDLSFIDLSRYIADIGESPFRGKQISDWLYKKCVRSFAEMTDIPETLRRRLEKDFSFYIPEKLKSHLSSDGTEKVALKLKDGKVIETAIIPAQDRTAVCVSTQVGCKFGCRFCASGIGGWKRNLSVAEILGQICHVRCAHPERPVTHVVFMGIG